MGDMVTWGEKQKAAEETCMTGRKELLSRKKEVLAGGGPPHPRLRLLDRNGCLFVFITKQYKPADWRWAENKCRSRDTATVAKSSVWQRIRLLYRVPRRYSSLFHGVSSLWVWLCSCCCFCCRCCCCRAFSGSDTQEQTTRTNWTLWHWECWKAESFLPLCLRTNPHNSRRFLRVPTAHSHSAAHLHLSLLPVQPVLCEGSCFQFTVTFSVLLLITKFLLHSFNKKGGEKNSLESYFGHSPAVIFDLQHVDSIFHLEKTFERFAALNSESCGGQFLTHPFRCFGFFNWK